MSLLLLFAGGPVGPIEAVLSIIEANDGLIASCSLSLSGATGLVEGDDAATSAGVLASTASSFIAEDDDAAATTAVLAIVGMAAVTEGNDVASASGAAAIVGSIAVIEENDAFSVEGAIGIDAAFTATEEDDALSISALMPIWYPRRGGDDEWARYERRQIEWEQQLRQIIDRSWQIANGEIDPVTFEPIPPPDYDAVVDELVRQALAVDQDRVQVFIAEQERQREEEAIAVLLVAA